MFRFRCENCDYGTNDETVPDCPFCGGYLTDVTNEELQVPSAEEVEKDDDTSEFYGLTIE